MTEPYVTVTLKLPRGLYLILAAQADDHSTQVAPLIVNGLERALRPVKKRRRYTKVSPELVERIRALHAADCTDGEIAERLDLSQPSVSRWRREVLKLDPVVRKTV